MNCAAFGGQPKFRLRFRCRCSDSLFHLEDQPEIVLRREREMDVSRQRMFREKRVVFSYRAAKEVIASKYDRFLLP